METLIAEPYKWPSIFITGNLNFEQFKQYIIDRLSFDYDKLQWNKHLVTIECKCWKVYNIDTEEDYKTTICECGQEILIFN